VACRFPEDLGEACLASCAVNHREQAPKRDDSGDILEGIHTEDTRRHSHAQLLEQPNLPRTKEEELAEGPWVLDVEDVEEEDAVVEGTSACSVCRCMARWRLVKQKY